MVTVATREWLEKRVKDYFGLMATLDSHGRRDLDAVMAFHHEDVRYDIPYLQQPIHFKNRDEVRAFLEKNQGLATDIVYDLKKMHVDVQGQVVTLEMTATRRLIPEKIAYANEYVFIFEFEDAKVRRVAEYANPLRAGAINQKLHIK